MPRTEADHEEIKHMILISDNAMPEFVPLCGILRN